MLSSSTGKIGQKLYYLHYNATNGEEYSLKHSFALLLYSKTNLATSGTIES